MRMLAAFASSEGGKAFARIEERWGRDPAASLEAVDDVLAHNLRAALILTMAEEAPETDEHAAGVERAIRGAEKIKERMNG